MCSSPWTPRNVLKRSGSVRAVALPEAVVTDHALYKCVPAMLVGHHDQSSMLLPSNAEGY